MQLAILHHIAVHIGGACHHPDRAPGMTVIPGDAMPAVGGDRDHEFRRPAFGIHAQDAAQPVGDDPELVLMPHQAMAAAAILGRP